MFRHPKYYKELRTRNKLDQVISHSASTEANSRRAPGPGPKLQATSTKRQASSLQRLKHQATSIKRRGTSIKLQAASVKLHDT